MAIVKRQINWTKEAPVSAQSLDEIHRSNDRRINLGLGWVLYTTLCGEEINQPDEYHVYHSGCTDPDTTEGMWLINALSHEYCIFCGKDIPAPILSKLCIIYVSQTKDFKNGVNNGSV